jgi:hypothetical protein
LTDPLLAIISVSIAAATIESDSSSEDSIIIDDSSDGELPDSPTVTCQPQSLLSQPQPHLQRLSPSPSCFLDMHTDDSDCFDFDENHESHNKDTMEKNTKKKGKNGKRNSVSVGSKRKKFTAKIINTPRTRKHNPKYY